MTLTIYLYATTQASSALRISEVAIKPTSDIIITNGSRKALLVTKASPMTSVTKSNLLT